MRGLLVRWLRKIHIMVVMGMRVMMVDMRNDGCWCWYRDRGREVVVVVMMVVVMIIVVCIV